MSVSYPSPVVVTQARVQLAVDQTAKAPPPTISEDVLTIEKAKGAGRARPTVNFKA